MIRVAVIDNHLAFREGVVHALCASPDVTVVGTGASAEDAIAICRETAPDVLLLDMNMPGNCTMAVAMLACEVPAVRALVLTVMADAKQICDLLETGARGYLLKGIGGLELLHAVRVIHGGDRYVTPALATYLLKHLDRSSAGFNLPDYLAVLNLSECRILALIAQGFSNREVGDRLALSERTVSHYMNSVVHKLSVRNRLEAARVTVPECSVQEWLSSESHGG